MPPEIHTVRRAVTLPGPHCGGFSEACRVEDATTVVSGTTTVDNYDEAMSGWNEAIKAVAE